MSRSGYTDDCEYIELYRNTVERAIKGKRGQAFLRELAAAMDAMPEKILIADELVDAEGGVCAIGSVLVARNIDASKIDYSDPQSVAQAVGIARCLAAEIEYMNDEYCRENETPEQRWQRMRRWVREQIQA